MADRDIVVFTEQGLGDSILAARYVPLLAGRGARVTLACPPVLRPMFERLDGVERLLSPPPSHPDGKLNLDALRFDAFAPLLSLPHLFSTTPDRVPARVPYLYAHAGRVAAWRSRYAAQGRTGHRRVGLVIEANLLSRSGTSRSIPPEIPTILAGRAGIDLVNLQTGPTGRALVARYPGAIDATAEPLPLDEYAAAIAATDVMISVDTMAAHLSGAMAHPTLVALPTDAAWQWGRGPDTTPWYPTATLFRRQPEEAWSDVLARMAEHTGPG
ncbi:MAG: hypothetical protein AB7O80_12310 [Acetobacteraceae bacterium]